MAEEQAKLLRHRGPEGIKSDTKEQDPKSPWLRRAFDFFKRNWLALALAALQLLGLSIVTLPIQLFSDEMRQIRSLLHIVPGLALGTLFVYTIGLILLFAATFSLINYFKKPRQRNAAVTLTALCLIWLLFIVPRPKALIEDSVGGWYRISKTMIITLNSAGDAQVEYRYEAKARGNQSSFLIQVPKFPTEEITSDSGDIVQHYIQGIPYLAINLDSEAKNGEEREIGVITNYQALFKDEEQNISLAAEEVHKTMSIKISFPKERPPKKIKAVHVSNGSLTTHPENFLTDDTRQNFALTINDTLQTPIFPTSTYRVSWSW